MSKTISYGSQSVDDKDIKSVVKVLKSNYLTQGPFVKKFEKDLKKNYNCKYSTVVSNGSVALFLIGKILKWKKGDIIAVPPITFVSSVNPIEHCGAKPLFVDINLNDYCMDPEKLEYELIKDKKKKIKAAIITDYGGQPAEWTKFKKIKDRFGIKLINDNCHAIGSSFNKNRGYATKFADFVSLSFHPVKAITTGEGGAILTNQKDLDNKAKLLRSHSIERSNKTYWKYKINSLGYNFRLSDINCAIGVSQLKKLNKFIKRRKEIALKYDKFFSNYSFCKTPYIFRNRVNSYHLYPLLIDFKKIRKNKEKFIKDLLKKKIKLQVHYIPVNSQPYFKKKYGFKKKKFENSIYFFNREVSLPIFYELKNKQLNYILSNFKTILK